MRLRTGTHLTLALLVAGALGVSTGSAATQSTAKKKASSKTLSVTKAGKRASRKSAASRRNKGQQVPTEDRITEIQQALAKDGSYSGTPSGKWDDSTVAAMKKFQESRGLNPSGKLDARTLQELGLGSHTAGAAPPLPPVSSSILAERPRSTAPRRQ